MDHKWNWNIISLELWKQTGIELVDGLVFYVPLTIVLFIGIYASQQNSDHELQKTKGNYGVIQMRSNSTNEKLAGFIYVACSVLYVITLFQRISHYG